MAISFLCIGFLFPLFDLFILLVWCYFLVVSFFPLFPCLLVSFFLLFCFHFSFDMFCMALSFVCVGFIFPLFVLSNLFDQYYLTFISFIIVLICFVWQFLLCALACFWLIVSFCYVLWQQFLKYSSIVQFIYVPHCYFLMFLLHFLYVISFSLYQFSLFWPTFYSNLNYLFYQKSVQNITCSIYLYDFDVLKESYRLYSISRHLHCLKYFKILVILFFVNKLIINLLL